MAEPAVHKTNIEAGVDDHVFIQVHQGDRPVVSLDLRQGGLTVRSNGYYIAALVTDVEWTGHKGDPQLLERYCAWCGEKLDLVSSRRHRCHEE